MYRAEFKPVTFGPVKMDLHFHTDGSGDGRTTEGDVAHFLARDTLDVIAITDHDTIEKALRIKERFPWQIIAGVEVTSAQGEIVGLGITEPIAPGMSAVETAQEIHDQGGKVLFQHPFHKNGLSEAVARAVHEEVGIDLVEVNNGRDVRKWKYGRLAMDFARDFDIPMVSNGDTHGPVGVGRSFTEVSRMPDVNNMDDVVNVIRYHQIRRSHRFAGLRALAQPELARREKRRAA